MLIEVDAVFESGVLRPLKPLALSENQQVRLTVDDQQAASYDLHRSAELHWLATQSAPFAGQWVALSGEKLIASGPDLASVRQAAIAAGVSRPLLTHLPEAKQEPFGGW